MAEQHDGHRGRAHPNTGGRQSRSDPTFASLTTARKLAKAGLARELADATVDATRQPVDHGDHFTPEPRRSELVPTIAVDLQSCHQADLGRLHTVGPNAA